MPMMILTPSPTRVGYESASGRSKPPPRSVPDYLAYSDFAQRPQVSEQVATTSVGHLSFLI
jgi:hypothetical protein